MKPIAIIAAIGLLALAAAVALVYLIGKGSARGRARTSWLALAFALAAMLGFAILALASIHYVIPPAWIAALGVAGIVVAGLFVRIGMDVRWRPSKLIVLGGLFVLAGIAFAMLAMSGIGPEGVIRSIYTVRAKQISDKHGFTALMPTGRELPTGSLPIVPLPDPDAGVSLYFGDFVMEERKASNPLTRTDLEKLVAPGTSPIPGFDVPADARLTLHSVQGRPAAAVEYAFDRKGSSTASRSSTAAVLVLELRGVEVRLASSSGERERDGSWVLTPSLTAGQLVKIAETLQPVR